ncbi:MAG: redoxin family protein, partial [Planctomycetales bacterium]|nr:redoxin family protein [Planctomycetales bacterium]
ELGKASAYVVVFTTLDCPIVQRYLPRLVELDEEYRSRGVRFVAMNVGPGDAIVEVARQALEAGAEFPFAKDFDGEVVAALGVARTPEAVVLDGERRLVYRGRIDSQYRYGGVRPNRGREDLKEAIDDVLAGREVRVPETSVDGCLITPDVLRAPDEPVTFAEHIAPLLKTHCQGCHRPGTTAPFSLRTYDEAVDHAEMIAEVVREQRMPPLFASEAHGTFINRREMTPAEIRLVRQWVAGDQALGDVSLLPEPLEPQQSKWRISEPDLVITMGKPIEIPADGYVPYKYVVLPHVFTEDTWISQVEILPGNQSAVHHCNMAYVEFGGDYSDAQFITGHVPGGLPMVLEDGVGFCIPKGAMLGLQLHYVTNGSATTDQTSVGFVFAKGRIDKRLQHFRVSDLEFEIEPEHPHYPVAASHTFDCNATGVGLFVHMHLRGKDMTFDAKYPDGGEETLLTVPNYNFDWQVGYVWERGAVRFPRGTAIECIAHFDNSRFNPYNPDPSVAVRYGPQTYHEMMYGFVFYTDDDEELGLEIDPATGHVVEGKGVEAERVEAETVDKTASR